IAIGGPIIKDLAHYFLTLEVKDKKDPKTIALPPGVTTTDPTVLAKLGPASAPFKEYLAFGKIDLQLAENQRLEFSAKLRDEHEIIGVGGANTAEWATKKKNNETRLDLKHELTLGSWLNEAHLTYEDAKWNPRPVTDAPGFQYNFADGST